MKEFDSSEHSNKSDFLNYTFTRKELLDSINKIVNFSGILCFTCIVRSIVTLFFDISTSTTISYRIFFILFHFLAFLFNIYILKYIIQPRIKVKSKKLANLRKYSIIVQIFGIANILMGPFLMTRTIIYYIDDGFYRGSALPIVFNQLFYACRFFIRNNLLTIIIYGCFLLFIYLLLNPTDTLNLELILKFFTAASISLLTFYQSWKENVFKSFKFMQKIIDKNDIFKIFCKNIPDIIYLESLSWERWIFKNETALKSNFNPENCTIKSEELYSTKNNSLKNTLKGFKNKKPDEGEDIIEIEEDFHNIDNKNLKVYKVALMKIQVNHKECLGIYIKDISNTALEILNATSENVSNTLICTFSHELQTPINQALGIATNLKSETKIPEEKMKIGLIKSAILKLFLRVEQYLYYGKIVSNCFNLCKRKTSFYTLFKQIKQMNFEYFGNRFKKTLIFNVDLKITKVNFFLDLRLALMIIQFIIDKLSIRNNLDLIEISAFLHNYNKIAEITIQGKGKYKSLSNLKIPKSGGIKPTYNDLFNPLFTVQEVGEFSNNFIQKICEILNTHIEYCSTFDNQEKYSIKFDTTPLKLAEDSLCLSESDFQEYGFEKYDDPSNFHHISRGITFDAKLIIGKPERNEILKPYIEKKSMPLVIIVDDEMMNRYAIIGMLKSFEVKSVEAEDGLKCLHIYENLNISEKENLLILMDLSMPNMDGITCCIRIREIEKLFKNPIVPIVALTGHDSEIEKKKAISAGMNEFCIKPLKKDKLKELLSKYLFRKSLGKL